MGIFDSIFGNSGSSGGNIPNFFGGGNAESYLDKVPGYLKPYFEPYINAGHRALPTLESQYGQLLNDPGGFYNRISAGYHESPGYQFRQKQGAGAALNAAAAGGMAGSPEHQQRAAQIAEDIANQDFNNYISQILSEYGLGLGGEERLAGYGLKAGTSLGEDLAQNAGNQARLAYGRELAQSQQDLQRESEENSFWGNLFNTGLRIGGRLLTGGLL